CDAAALLPHLRLPGRRRHRLGQRPAAAFRAARRSRRPAYAMAGHRDRDPGGSAMKITGMNHFNVLTDDVEATRKFYVGVLGLTEGERPPFKFPGLWLYAGGHPILHISGARLPKERAGV